MRQRANELRDYRTRAVRHVGIVGSNELIVLTRIDTGKLKSNFQIGLGSPVNVVRESFVPGKFGSTTNEVIQRATRINRNIINTFDADRFSSLWITNSVDYGRFVFDGSEPRFAAIEAITSLQSLPIFIPLR